MEGFPNSPLFDTTYGLGGNGPYIANVSDPTTFPVTTPTIIPNRTGGGCLDNGPFDGLVVNMGMGERSLTRSLESQPTNDEKVCPQITLQIACAVTSALFWSLKLSVTKTSPQLSTPILISISA